MPRKSSKQEQADPKAEPKPLNAREQKFVAHYCVHFNGAAAVREAYPGTPEENARFYARELLTKPHIQRHVAKVREELGVLHFELAHRATAKLAAMMEADRTAVFDADGNLKDPREWPEECKLLIAGIEIEETMVGEGDEAQLVRTKKVKLEGPKGILDSIHKVTGAIVEKKQLVDSKGRPVDPSPATIVVTVGEAPKKGKP